MAPVYKHEYLPLSVYGNVVTLLRSAPKGLGVTLTLVVGMARLPNQSVTNLVQLTLVSTWHKTASHPLVSEALKHARLIFTTSPALK